MPKFITLALGYLTVPLEIKSSVRTLTTEPGSKENKTAHWTFASTISINCFVQSPPTIYPTREKHVVQLKDDANPFEQETLVTLASSMNPEGGQKSHGLITITDDLLGILSPTDHHATFVLQIVQFDPKGTDDSKSYRSQTKTPSLELSAKPAAIMELCQLWPDSKSQLAKIGAHVYQLACLYGYWDNWRIFEGICQTHQIDVDQLLNIQRQ